MLVVLPPIFVADTKIIYGYNFDAPLKPLATKFDDKLGWIEFSMARKYWVNLASKIYQSYPKEKATELLVVG